MFSVIYILCTSLAYRTAIDLLPISAAVLFAIGIAQTNPWKYRLSILVNSSLWIIYDIVMSAPIPMLATHGIAVASVAVGIVRLDIKKWIYRNKV